MNTGYWIKDVMWLLSIKTTMWHPLCRFIEQVLVVDKTNTLISWSMTVQKHVEFFNSQVDSRKQSVTNLISTCTNEIKPCIFVNLYMCKVLSTVSYYLDLFILKGSTSIYSYAWYLILYTSLKRLYIYRLHSL